MRVTWQQCEIKLIVQMLFSSCLYPLFQNERAKSLGLRYKKVFIPRANKAHYHVKVVAFGLTLKAEVFGSR